VARFAVFATAALNGQVIEQHFVRQGQRLQIGGSPSLAVPLPAGFPYIARVAWTGPGAARVQDGRGEYYTLTPDREVRIDLDAVSIRFTMAPQYSLKRLTPPSARISVAWLCIVILASLGTMQGEFLYGHRCVLGDVMVGQGWTAQQWPECHPEMAANSAVGIQLTAEYLARLLREDYAGDEAGQLELEERPEGEKETEQHRYYMPAGGEGPVTKMGGAQEVTVESVRGAPDALDEVASKKKEELAELWAEDVGTPIEQAIEAVEEPVEGDGRGVDDVADAETEQTLSEDEKGWGIPDWYDTEDVVLEELEIEFMLRYARNRLAIDPNDPAALSTLSYYQYLAEQYDESEKTWDRYIAIYPEDAAGYNNKALIFKRRKDFEREERLYRVALALEPDDETALNNLAVNLSHQGRFDEALAVMQHLEVIDPGDAYADLHRSKIYADMGDFEQAITYLEKALMGRKMLDTLHDIEFRQDIRVDPSFDELRKTREFRGLLYKYYGENAPLGG
jgi:tetratricopeptide (TPR) repeat protein